MYFWKQFAGLVSRPSFRNTGISLITLVLALTPLALTRGEESGGGSPKLTGYADPAGLLQIFDQNGRLDLTSTFFQNLGTNGRTCGTCHQPSDAMSVSAAHIQARFDATQGLDPIFRTVDGSVCDHGIDTSTVKGRSAAYLLLRTRGLIRIAIAPAASDFQVMSVVNPYGCGDTDTLSMYRRPLPAANLRFLTTIMWDGRESTDLPTLPINGGNYPGSLISDLEHQALDATLGHAQGLPPGPTATQQQAIMAVEFGLSAAQGEDRQAEDLDHDGAHGGPRAIARQKFYVGTNDPVGLDPANPVPFSFNTKIFDLYDAWHDSDNPRQQAIARGQAIFNTKTFKITGVAGLNGTTFSNGVVGPQSITSTCGICHDTPNLGNHSVSAPLNIGVADPPGGNNSLDTSYLPVITICQKPALTTCVQTTDPGRALITGKFADVGKFKGPILRGLAARAPYFHNGSAQTLDDIVEFYDSRFHIGFTAQEKADLIAFLSAL